MTEQAMVVSNDGRLVARTLGVDEGAIEYNSYEDAVDDLIAKSNETEKQILELRWTIGRVGYLVSEKASQNGTKYGGHNIEELASDLGLHSSSIYTAIKFYKQYTLEDIERLRGNDIPYRRAVMMMGLDEVSRDQIEDAITNHRVSDDTLSRMVKNAKNGVIMPSDPAAITDYIERCKNNDFPEEEEEEDPEDEEKAEKEPEDPVDKLVANVRTSNDDLSQVLTSVSMKMNGLINVLKSDLYTDLDDEAKAKFSFLVGLSEELSKTLTVGWRLIKLLPNKKTAEADAVKTDEG